MKESSIRIKWPSGRSLGKTECSGQGSNPGRGNYESSDDWFALNLWWLGLITNVWCIGRQYAHLSSLHLFFSIIYILIFSLSWSSYFKSNKRKRKWINGEGKLRTRVLNLLIENWFSINSVHNFRNSESKSRTRVSNFRIRSGFRYKQTLNFFLIPSTPKSNIGGKKTARFQMIL